MATYILNILQRLVQDLQRVCGHFGTLCIKDLKARSTIPLIITAFISYLTFV